MNGRDYTQLATLTTRVVNITENGGGINGATSPTNGNAGGAFAVNGTRGNLNDFMLDGIDNNSNDNAGNILKTNVDQGHHRRLACIQNESNYLFGLRLCHFRQEDWLVDDAPERGQL